MQFIQYASVLHCVSDSIYFKTNLNLAKCLNYHGSDIYLYIYRTITFITYYMDERDQWHVSLLILTVASVENTLQY